MRRSIRTQIVFPLVVIQGLAVAVLVLIAATLAAARGERQIIARLNGVTDSLGRGNFPYTGSILEQMAGLSGAQFVAYDERGEVAASSVPVPGELARPLLAVPVADHLDSLGSSPRIAIGPTTYFAVRLRSPGRAPGSSLVVLYPETSWRQARRDAAIPPLAFGAGSLALTAAAACWVAHRIGGRIRRLERQVARIAEGDFQELELGAEGDEVHDLSRSINRMAVQLGRMSRTIRQSERTRLLAQLAAGLAHQLRNSLTGARMSIQLHARRHPAPDGDRSLDVALRQLAMTEEHVRGLLSLGRLEQRPRAVLDAARLLEEVALLVRPSCEHAKVALDLSPNGRAFTLRADESGVRAAVLNLALNAVEAAGPGGRVGLTLGLHDGRILIEVADSGPGPPRELAADLFEPFVTGKPEGSGLGLALAHQVAVEHGGRLTWDREAGETCFRLSLPRDLENSEHAV
jgi:signal transduction histidine kinase